MILPAATEGRVGIFVKRADADRHFVVPGLGENIAAFRGQAVSSTAGCSEKCADFAVHIIKPIRFAQIADYVLGGIFRITTDARTPHRLAKSGAQVYAAAIPANRPPIGQKIVRRRQPSCSVTERKWPRFRQAHGRIKSRRPAQPSKAPWRIYLLRPCRCGKSKPNNPRQKNKIALSHTVIEPNSRLKVSPRERNLVRVQTRHIAVPIALYPVALY